MLLEVLKYLCWGLTTVIPVAGQFFYKFTEDDPANAVKYRFTGPGKIALILTALGILISLSLSVLSDSQDAADRTALAGDKQRVQSSLDKSSADLADAKSQLVALASDSKTASDKLLEEIEGLQGELAKLSQTLAAGSGQSAVAQQQVATLQKRVTSLRAINFPSKINPAIAPLMIRHPSATP